MGATNNNNGKIINRILWKNEKVESFLQAVKSAQIQEQINNATSLIGTDINMALKIFNKCLLEAAHCMVTKTPLGKKKTVNNWFDYECVTTRRNVRKLLRKFRKSLNTKDRESYCKSRREYKNLLKHKKKQYKDRQLSELLDTLGNQSEFWKKVNQLAPKHTRTENNISIDMWYQHFRTVLETDDSVNHEVEDDILGDIVGDVEGDMDLINEPITKDEVTRALISLKNGKAPGPDGIIGEIFKNASDVVLDFFVKLFNEIFNKGVYPENWTDSIIHPLHKKGNPNDPNNYRGISLSDVSGKLFSTIINRRLQMWVDMNDTIGEQQAGFRKDYSTVDHIFTLLAIVQKQLSLNRKLYVAFIDFEKAFDSISRKLLWPILQKQGIRGKLFRCVKSMYNVVKARVRDGASLTESIHCLRGVKQGDVCSPILFSLFINELTLDIIKGGKHGAILKSTLVEIFILLFADDIILSETAVGLQNQLNILYRSSEKLQLKVNLDKSNIIVFRKGGYLAAHEKWFCGKNRIEVVNAYKYLGLYFTTKLRFSTACSDLALQSWVF